MTDDPFERAVQRDRRSSGVWPGFRQHLFWYVIVNVGLVATWYLSGEPRGSGYPWFVWPLLGWGVGVASHWWAARGHRTT